jgi:hypothetical protein
MIHRRRFLASSIAFEGNPELAPMWAGESCSVVKQIKPAGEIVRELARDAAAALAAAAAK